MADQYAEMKQAGFILISDNDIQMSPSNTNVYPVQLMANVSATDSDFETSRNKEDLFTVQDIVLDAEDVDEASRSSESSNSKTKTIQCPKCMYQTSDKTSMNSHMRKHNSSFICKVCKVTFASITSLIDHFNKQHPQNAEDASGIQHYCPMCPFLSIEKLEYDKHITRHETAAHMCYICGQPFAKQVSMKWHIKFKHGIMDMDDQESSNISINTDSVTTVTEHNNMVSTDPTCSQDYENSNTEMEQDTKPFLKRFICLYCTKNFSSKLLLKYHCWRSHKEKLHKNQIKELQDLMQQNWNEPFASNSKGISSNSYRFQCPLCSFSTGYKSTIDRHVKKHDESKFACDICGMPFTMIGNLHHHKKVNHPDVLTIIPQRGKRHKCALCIYGTSYKSTLERHLRTHGIAKFHCELCTMPFVFTGSFMTHRKLKHQLYTRDFEETIFTDKITDDSSLASGSGKFIKRRKCPYCNALMSSASKLNRHLRTHKNAGYYCGSCSIFYNQRAEFETHMKKHLLSKGFNDVQCLGFAKGRAELPNEPSQTSNNTKVADSSTVQVMVQGSEQADMKSANLPDSLSVENHPTEMEDISEKNNEMYSNPTNADDDNNRNHLATISQNMLKIDLTERLSAANVLLRHTDSQNDQQPYPTQLENSLGISPSDKLILRPSSQERHHHYEEPTAEQCFQLRDSILTEKSNFLSSQQDTFIPDRQSFVSQIHQEPLFEANKHNFRSNQNSSFFSNREMFLTSRERNDHDKSNCSEISHQNSCNEINTDDLCACKLVQPIHGEVLTNPPFKGRFAKLISDFDDFASRPFACSLCFYRCSILKDLFDHVQNHLTGCCNVPIPTTAKFSNENYTQGLTIEPSDHIQNNTLNMAYIN